MLKNEITRKQEIKSGANANDHDERCSSTVIGGMVMEEGLRCSRSNGKQWRCLQPRLEGYSKCEHHLDQEKMRRRRHIICGVKFRYSSLG